MLAPFLLQKIEVALATEAMAAAKVVVTAAMGTTQERPPCLPFGTAHRSLRLAALRRHPWRLPSGHTPLSLFFCFSLTCNTSSSVDCTPQALSRHLNFVKLGTACHRIMEKRLLILFQFELVLLGYRLLLFRALLLKGYLRLWQG